MGAINEIMEDRRSGMDRREEPPNCTQPCKPIVDDLDKRDEKLKEDLDKRNEKIHKKLDRVFECLETKIPSKLFWKALGFGAFFVFVVMGGTLWDLKSSISSIGTDVKVMAVTVESNSDALKGKIEYDQLEYKELERRVDKIEKGETFYNFYYKDKNPGNYNPQQ